MKFTARIPLNCPRKDIDHERDHGMIQHGTQENPIPVEDLRTDDGQYVQWEYVYAGKTIGYADRCGQFLLQEGEKAVDRIVFRLPEGQHHVFYFDISRQRKQVKSDFEKVFRAKGICPRCGGNAPGGDHPDCPSAGSSLNHGAGPGTMD